MLQAEPEIGAVAEQLAETQRHAWGHRLLFLKQVVKRLPGDTEQPGDLGLGMVDRWQHILAQQLSGRNYDVHGAVQGAIERTIAHLREVQPTLYFNVPRGYEMMLPALESDAALARQFFGRLRMLFYAGAGMPVSTCSTGNSIRALRRKFSR